MNQVRLTSSLCVCVRSLGSVNSISTKAQVNTFSLLIATGELIHTLGRSDPRRAYPQHRALRSKIGYSHNLLSLALLDPVLTVFVRVFRAVQRLAGPGTHNVAQAVGATTSAVDSTQTFIPQQARPQPPMYMSQQFSAVVSDHLARLSSCVQTPPSPFWFWVVLLQIPTPLLNSILRLQNPSPIYTV